MTSTTTNCPPHHPADRQAITLHGRNQSIRARVAFKASQFERPFSSLPIWNVRVCRATSKTLAPAPFVRSVPAPPANPASHPVARSRSGLPAVSSRGSNSEDCGNHRHVIVRRPAPAAVPGHEFRQRVSGSSHVLGVRIAGARYRWVAGDVPRSQRKRHENPSVMTSNTRRVDDPMADDCLPTVWSTEPTNRPRDLGKRREQIPIPLRRRVSKAQLLGARSAKGDPRAFLPKIRRCGVALGAVSRWAATRRT